MNNLRVWPQLDEEKHDTHCYLDYLFYTFIKEKPAVRVEKVCVIYWCFKGTIFAAFSRVL